MPRWPQQASLLLGLVTLSPEGDADSTPKCTSSLKGDPGSPQDSIEGTWGCSSGPGCLLGMEGVWPLSTLNFLLGLLLHRPSGSFLPGKVASASLALWTKDGSMLPPLFLGTWLLTRVDLREVTR